MHNLHRQFSPKSYKAQNLSICHWNLNSICAHNYIKVNLLRAYLSIHKFDIIRHSETYLDSTIRSDDGNLSIPGYISKEEITFLILDVEVYVFITKNAYL